jgi:hypothetical protein
VIILLVGVIFVGTVVALPAINYSTFQAVDEQQLKNTALNVLSSMLLGVGSPANWGSDEELSIAEFGLAYSSPFSKYVLDSDKVQRLDINSPWHLTREQVKDLLNLQGYEFELAFYRPFTTMPIVDIDFDNEIVHFGVTVTRTQDGAPIPNAKVNVTIFMSSLSGDFEYNLGPYETDASGSFYDSIATGPDVLTIIAIMEVTAGGMSTVVVEQDGYLNLDEFIKISSSGDLVRLSIRTDEIIEDLGIPPAERDVTGAWAYKSGNRIAIFDDIGKITWGKGNEYVDILFEGLRVLNPTALIIRLEVVIPASVDIDVPDWIKGRTFPVYICGALSFDAIEEILTFGFEAQGRSVIAINRRLVVIADMTYITELALWKDPI